MQKKLWLLFIQIFLLFNLNLIAQINLPTLFTDHMVLQRNTPVIVWGKAQKGQSITVSFIGKQTQTPVSADGDWSVILQPMKHGGPYDMTISSGSETKVIKDILIGDVWLCSGQSNMEMPLAGWGKINNYEEEIKNANYPGIRLLQTEHTTSNKPMDNLVIHNNAGWQQCTPSSVAEFSSVAYFFAREINRTTHIPIGLIHSSWGGTVIEAWISGASLLNTTDFNDAVKQLATLNEDQLKTDFANKAKEWNTIALEKDRGFVNKQPQWASEDIDDSQWNEMKLPESFENSELGNFDGVVWYRKKINIPVQMTGKDLVLKLGPIDDFDITYFNGHKIGKGSGYNIPRQYHIPSKLVKKGRNVITVRVFDTGGGGGIYDKQTALSLTDNNKTIYLNGNWKYKVGLAYNELPPYPMQVDGPNRPSVLYNAMIHPLIQFKIKGTIWYQGESNAERAIQYRQLFPLLIQDWRQKWNIGNFPFYFVQLANYMKADKLPPENSDWAMLREAQANTLSVSNTGMAVTIDIGNESDIHPKNKQDVGKRLALIALDHDYGIKGEYSGPIFKKAFIKNNTMQIVFTHAEKLIQKGDKLTGFAIAGADKKFYWADARIENNSVIVSCSKVQQPVAVRYAWGNNPSANLYNSRELPAVPFRTDNW